MTPLRAGCVFADAYEIVRPISAGGMGIVYEVVHLGTKRHRALKVMLAHIVSDPVMRERFSFEAVVSADIQSEHITEIFDAGIDKESDCPYLVMELLQGEDLAARIKRGERFSKDETLELMGQAARALVKTHEKGVVHRDLKPDNLFLTRRDDGSPRLKILDFGIAKVVKENLTGPQATTKTFGTPFYMAREQITGESALIGPRSDLYALAQIVFTMLVGAAYFQEEARSSEGNILAVLMAVGNGLKEPASARALRRGVELPPSFDAWFAKATALSPKDRFANAIEMIDALKDALDAPIRVVPVPAPSAPDARAASSSSLEDSFTSAERGKASLVAAADASGAAPIPEAFHQTGGPQSITTAVPKIPSKGRTGLYAGLAALAIASLVGIGAARLSSRESSGSEGQRGGATAREARGASPGGAPEGKTAETAGIAPTSSEAKVGAGEPAPSVVASSDAVASATASATVAPSHAVGAGRAATPPPLRGPASSGPTPPPETPTATPKSHAASKGPLEDTL